MIGELQIRAHFPEPVRAHFGKIPESLLAFLRRPLGMNALGDIRVRYHIADIREWLADDLDNPAIVSCLADPVGCKGLYGGHALFKALIGRSRAAVTALLCGKADPFGKGLANGKLLRGHPENIKSPAVEGDDDQVMIIDHDALIDALQCDLKYVSFALRHVPMIRHFKGLRT